MTPLLKIVGITIVAAGLGGQIPRPQIISAPMSDEAITANVEREFRTNPQLGGLSIDVSTAKAMVTLEGSVRSLIEKQRADALCRQAAGVAGVINRLQVEQSARPLDQLATTITERFASDQFLRGLDLLVSANEGIVTLDGTVDNPRLRIHAERLARQVPDVLVVRNNIRIDEPSDARLRSVVLGELKSDGRFDPLLVKVLVENQVVTLQGYVESPMQKDLAENRVESIPGVLSVQNRLVVAYSPGPTYR